MKPPFVSLVAIYLRSVFGVRLPALRELRRPKQILKLAGIAALAILVVADLGVLFVMMNLSLYNALKPVGMQGLLLLNAATSAAVIVLLLGFTTAISTWSMSAMESAFLPMPIRPRELLGAKMLVVYCTEFLFSAFFLGVAMTIFGIKEAPPFMFYVNGILTALALPLVPIALSYLVLVPLMSSVRLFRNKNFLMYSAGIVGLAFALAFNFYIQSGMANMSDPAWVVERFAGPDSIISAIGTAWPPSWLAWKALADAGRVPGFLAAAANLALGLAAVGATAVALGPAYGRSVATFGESTLSRRKADASFMKNSFTSRPAMLTLFLREFRLMNREPVYLLNGPFVPVLMPLIIAISFAVRRDSFASLAKDLGPILGGPAGYLIPAAFGGFLGTSTSIAPTAVSRDAKALAWIRSLPVSPLAFMGAKFLHAEVFAVFGAIVGGVGGGLVLGIGAPDIAVATALALAYSALINLAGLYLDAAMPKLAWDTPIAALKQNFNSVIAILGSMGLLGVLGYLSTQVRLPRYGYAVALGAALLVPFAAMAAAFPRFARRRMAAWEA